MNQTNWQRHVTLLMIHALLHCKCFGWKIATKSCVTFPVTLRVHFLQLIAFFDAKFATFRYKYCIRTNHLLWTDMNMSLAYKPGLCKCCWMCTIFLVKKHFPLWLLKEWATFFIFHKMIGCELYKKRWEHLIYSTFW